MEEYLKVFSIRLKMLRDEKHYTQQEVAETIGIVRSTISQYETIKREPVLTIIIKLAKFFDVNIPYLIGESDNRRRFDC